MFDFEIRHISRSKYITIDSFSRKSRTLSDNTDELYQENLDDFINSQLYAVSVFPVTINSDSDTSLLEDGYFNEFWDIARYLTELYIFSDVKEVQSRRRFIRNTYKYMVLYRYL